MTEQTLTAEEQAELDKENPEVLTEEEKAAAAAAEAEGEDAGTGGTEGKTDEEIAAEAAAKAAEEAEGTGEPSTEEELRTEVAELKARNTTLDQTLRNMEGKFSQYDKVLREANLLDEVDPDQQAEIDRANAGRKVFLDQMWEQMELNPKFEDIAQVVTTHNKQLVISAYAEQVVEDDPSVDMATAEIAVKQAIDELTNPHKFFYSQIKIIEKAGEGEEKTEEEKKKEQEAITKKKAELKDAPGSIHNMGGASKGAAGWTMTKLDEMDEVDMINADIPEAVISQWKAGTLPK